MRIGHFVPAISQFPGYEHNVSGHIQIPLRTIQLLAERGHEVHLITNVFSDDRVLPWCMPEGVPVHYVIDSRRRLESAQKKGAPASGVYPLAFLRQLRQIKSIVRERRLEVLHLHGQARTVQLGALLKFAGLRVPTVCSLVGSLTKGMRIGFLLRRAGTIVTATDFVAETCRPFGIEAIVLRHGVVRDFRAELESAEPKPRRRVLFWRDLTLPNGADVALSVFDAVAPEFPHLSFDIAVRPHDREVSGVDELCRRHPNVHLHRFPYPPGVTLAGLLHEAICAVLPFRRFSIQPQLAIAETLAAGVPVVASDLDSTSELLTHGRHGLIAPVGDIEATADALRILLADPAKAEEMGRCAARNVLERWNWLEYINRLFEVYELVIQQKTPSSRS